jgi:hypothetical protein
MSFDLRLKRVGVLPAGVKRAVDASGVEFSAAYSAISTLSFTAIQAATGMVDEGAEIAVEVYDGTAWVEPEMGRFIVVSSSYDELDPTLTGTFECVGYVPFQLDAAVLHSSGGAVRDFHDTAGLILNLAGLAEPKARGWGTGITYTFDNFVDSDGNAWAGAAADVDIELPADLTTHPRSPERRPHHRPHCRRQRSTGNHR